MLKGIDPVLRGELLKALDEMGHGDTFALVDRNFPAYQAGKQVIDLGEVTASRAAHAVFSVFPLDTFGPTPLQRMGIDGDLESENECHHEVRTVANDSAGEDWPWAVIPRLDFYPAMSGVSLVIRCLEDAHYACFLFRKGVI